MTTKLATGYRITAPACADFCDLCDDDRAQGVVAYTRVGADPKDHRTYHVCEDCLEALVLAHAAHQEGAEEVNVRPDEDRGVLRVRMPEPKWRTLAE